ncbi:recombinase family protein [Chryseobacterium taklimakanense]|uniref:Recombinase family protein n=1 Tax=Chryseobacterium taklimakanense TaxID=536441 RepID=A0A3G8WPU4_9FLAO|nr:recombinase family protein [Chryseobacterium taklimakanense]AZI21517.1 recombinase family protein [Chryseobacterium taklimakanense]
MLIGYARVSKFEQNLDLQTDALKNLGIEKIFVDKVSGVKSEKPQLNQLLNFIRKGDTLTVWRLDRVGRTTVGLIQFVNELNEKGINFKSITENIDTGSASGKLIFQIFCVLAEHERNVLIERTNAGLKSARARGKMGGRPKGMTEKYIKIAPLVKASYESRKLPVEEIMKAYNIGSKTTFYKIINLK